MKLLIYNWVQFDNPFMTGGGVTLYLRNVMEELLRREDVEIYFLSSGEQYGLFRREPRILRTPNIYRTPRLKTFRLVNSPVKAPAHDAFHSIDVWLKDTVTTTLLEKFMREHGPFDALHLHNLEGISANVLTIPKGEHVKRLFYTFHNYMPLCPQIELLYDNRLPCNDFRDGNRCVGCIAHNNRMADLIRFQRMGGFLKRRGLAAHPIGGFLFDANAGLLSFGKAIRNISKDTIHGFRTGFKNWHLRPRQDRGGRLGWIPTQHTKPLNTTNLRASEKGAHAYRQWRHANGQALKNNADGIFAVSDLCRDTALKFLPPATKVETIVLPIDIDLPDEKRDELRADREHKRDGVTISFIGYDIASKGLPFLIDTLSEIDDPFYKENVDLLIVSRIGPRREAQLCQLEPRFRSIRVINSYSRDQLTALSNRIDLNIVPSIWWETFNQVTVELARLGVPSLVSSNVGAKQALPHQKTFVFNSSDHADLRTKLDHLIRNSELRKKFFETELQIPSVADHVDVLLRHYGGGN